MFTVEVCSCLWIAVEKNGLRVENFLTIAAWKAQCGIEK